MSKKEKKGFPLKPTPETLVVGTGPANLQSEGHCSLSACAIDQHPVGFPRIVYRMEVVSPKAARGIADYLIRWADWAEHGDHPQGGGG